MLHHHLKELDQVVDPGHIARAESLSLACVSYEPVERIPKTVNCPVPGWPSLKYAETFHDMDKMLLAGLAPAWIGAHVRDDRMYTVRANYGVGTMASMFGCKIELVGEVSMPWAFHISDEQLDRILDAGQVDIAAGLGTKVLETERYFLDTIARYENLAQAVKVYVCDTQGPFDTAHLVMGHKIYTEVYDNPERVHRLLDIVTDTTIRFTRAQKELLGEDGPHSYHTGMVVNGGIRVCDDAGINLSAGLYREFSKPYNERLLAACGGGWVHYCGNGKQILPEVLSTEGVSGINFGNPEMQDLPSLYAEATKRKVAVLGWVGKASALPANIRTGITTAEGAMDLESARAIAAA